jgi:predicted nuclease with TOPRIM domain
MASLDFGDFKMIKYEDIIKRIANIEKKKIKNEERIKLLSDENNTLTANLKILNQKKEMLEKMDQDLADLIPDKKKTVAN